jgi:hypothetical protein
MPLGSRRTILIVLTVLEDEVRNPDVWLFLGDFGGMAGTGVGIFRRRYELSNVVGI